MIALVFAALTCLIGSVVAGALRLARRGVYTPSGAMEMLALAAGIFAPPIAIYLIWPVASWWSVAIYLLPSVLGSFWVGGFVARVRERDARAARLASTLLFGSIVTLIGLMATNFLGHK
ncbi:MULTISPECIES: hypothetical protein [unclassified Sphingomonas]|uniref:hypothetical protein n=1 Tax=unclassified Sphingomonas TaxID=196159 RepID=UPI0007140AE4|nr:MULTISPECIES: hypothetical protein [unclassified Sphingomonas]KRB95141.1 hypothetical protein ASE22_04355 [Sphingomonas sp. Root720]